jgi:hypothetical protein
LHVVLQHQVIITDAMLLTPAAALAAPGVVATSIIRAFY